MVGWLTTLLSLHGSCVACCYLFIVHTSFRAAAARHIKCIQKVELYITALTAAYIAACRAYILRIFNLNFG